MKIQFHATGREYEVEEVGVLRLQRIETETLGAGDSATLGGN